MKIEVINRYNMESCSLRLTLFDVRGQVSDIIEGPTKFVIERALLEVSPQTKLRLRKVKK